MLEFVQRSAKRTPFPKPEHMDPLLYAILVARGFDSEEAAERFLHPGPSELNDPFLMFGMQDAARRIERAVAAGEKICVYGDYDVDGVCASAILADHLRSLGAHAEIYLPDRHREGYGLNGAAIHQVAEKSDLLITVDCGISSIDEIRLASTLGLDCIVTDHHRPSTELPDCVIVHPQLGSYPCPVLCGAGVALKLVEALSGRDAALHYIDLAALATICDIVSLKDENRAIVSLGLAAMNSSPRPGIKALLESASLRDDTSITAETLAFQLGPRINAGGRLASAELPSRLLLSRDVNEACPLAEELEGLNQKRRRLQDEIIAEAKAQLSSYDLSRHRVIIISGRDWDLGVVGLAAGKLTEETYCPSIVLTNNGELLTGSCRSIKGVDIHRALQAVEHLLDHYGGHAQAAGLSMPPENLPLLQQELDRWIGDNVPDSVYIPKKEYDLEVPFDQLTIETVRQLEALEPTGCDNPPPVFRAHPFVYRSRAVGLDRKHLQLSLSSRGTVLNAIYFGAGHLENELDEQIDILYKPSINAFNGSTSLQAMVLEHRDPQPSATISRWRRREADLQRDFLTDLFYNVRMDRPRLSTAGTLDDICAQLRSAPRGTLVLAADLGIAQELLSRAADARLDVRTGKGPVDPRCFNTLLLYPCRPIPPGFDRVFAVGMPDIYGAIQVPAAVSWKDQLPGLDQLRALFRELRKMAVQGRSKSAPQAAMELAETLCMSRAGALAGIYILMDSQLFVAEGKGALQYTDKKKVELNASRYYRLLSDWMHI